MSDPWVPLTGAPEPDQEGGMIPAAGEIGSRAESSRLHREAWEQRPKRPPRSRLNLANLRKPPVPGFGELVRLRRMELGFTLDQVADAVGATARMLKYLEAGATGCSYRLARALGDVLDLELVEPLPDVVPAPEPMAPTLHDLWIQRGERPQGSARRGVAGQALPPSCDLDPLATTFTEWERWHRERFGPSSDAYPVLMKRYRQWVRERLGTGAAIPEEVAEAARQQRRMSARRVASRNRFGWNGR